MWNLVTFPVKGRSFDLGGLPLCWMANAGSAYGGVVNLTRASVLGPYELDLGPYYALILDLSGRMSVRRAGPLSEKHQYVNDGHGFVGLAPGRYTIHSLSPLRTGQELLCFRLDGRTVHRWVRDGLINSRFLLSSDPPVDGIAPAHYHREFYHRTGLLKEFPCCLPLRVPLTLFRFGHDHGLYNLFFHGPLNRTEPKPLELTRDIHRLDLAWQLPAYRSILRAHRLPTRGKTVNECRHDLICLNFKQLSRQTPAARAVRDLAG